MSAGVRAWKWSSVQLMLPWESGIKLNFFKTFWVTVMPDLLGANQHHTTCSSPRGLHPTNPLQKYIPERWEVKTTSEEGNDWSVRLKQKNGKNPPKDNFKQSADLAIMWPLALLYFCYSAEHYQNEYLFVWPRELQSDAELCVKYFSSLW